MVYTEWYADAAPVGMHTSTACRSFRQAVFFWFVFFMAVTLWGIRCVTLAHMEDHYIDVMNHSIARLVANAARLAWRYPRYLVAFYRLARYQKQASLIRAAHRSMGIPVPAFLILSITRRCNLRCTGCYSLATAEREKSEGRRDEMDGVTLERVVGEGNALGVSFMLLAGGEPLVRKDDIFRIARRNPQVIFPVFTNGTLIDDKVLNLFQRTHNVFPIISIEGRTALTDTRRGTGVYRNACDRMKMLSGAGVFFGVSFTVMKQNVEEILSEAFIGELVRAGAGVFFYNEYTPIEDGSEEYCISEDQRASMLEVLALRKKRFGRLMLSFPGDEDAFGGCLSSCRGFAHIAPDGRLEACPFAPFGADNAAEQSLAEALQSPVLAKIRDHHHELAETSGGCALWNKRDWVQSL